MQREDDDRSMVAQAWGWGYQVISISLEMVVPAILGLWIDRLIGTLPLLLILGAVFGMIAGMVHLLQFAQRLSKRGEQPTHGAGKAEEGEDQEP